MYLLLLLFSCGRSLSEADACRMATEALTQHYKEMYKFSVSGCSNFESSTSAGKASIEVQFYYSNDTMSAGASTSRKVSFHRSDQGWRAD